jgi:hypothetical protein
MFFGYSTGKAFVDIVVSSFGAIAPYLHLTRKAWSARA